MKKYAKIVKIHVQHPPYVSYNAHSALIDPSLNAECQLAEIEEEQTAHHIITSCPMFVAESRMIFGSHEVTFAQAGLKEVRPSSLKERGVGQKSAGNI
jgi:hypothetical protein